jgi:4-hydroxy-3-methylbut-2-enyl diphosphate reductase
MLVLRAETMGMCFGVRDALHVLEGVAEPAAVTVHGELVHNSVVLADLDRRGFQRTTEQARAVPDTPAVLITAHGVSERERARLQRAGKQLIDTTCPLVRKAHAAAQDLAAEGRRVIVLGRPGHVEVRGIVEDLESPIVVATEHDVATWPDRRLGIVCQTTTEEDHAARLLLAIRAANPHADVVFRDTICGPTKARVEALAGLLPRVDALVVVGGRNSNNTQRLAAAGLRAGRPVLHVQNAAEVRAVAATWFAGMRVVGLTAGTSTLAATIDEVEAALRALGALEPAPALSSTRAGS